MTTIGSGVAGSIAATNTASQNRAQQAQAEQAEDIAAAKLLHRLADIQQHEVENSEQSEMDTRAEDRRQRRRRNKGEKDETGEGDIVELSAAVPTTEQAAAETPAQPAPPPVALPKDSTTPGSILDVQA